MFGKSAKKLFLKMQLNDITKFTENLKIMDSNEIGLVVAVATSFKNEWMEKGIDVSTPMQTHHTNPTLVLDIITLIKDLQKTGGETLASGLMVWVHSLRAGNDLKLRGAARNMWKELSRGFPYVQEAAMDARFFLPSILDVKNYDQFPDGLTPEPI